MCRVLAFLIRLDVSSQPMRWREPARCPSTRAGTTSTTTPGSAADMVGTDKVKGSPSRSCSWSTRPTPRRSASASPAATGYHPARVPLRTTASTWTRSTRMAPGSMNYIKIRLVLVLVLDTILPHRLLRPSSSPASYVFYSYSLAMSTGISAL